MRVRTKDRAEVAEDCCFDDGIVTVGVRAEVMDRPCRTFAILFDPRVVWVPCFFGHDVTFCTETPEAIASEGVWFVVHDCLPKPGNTLAKAGFIGKCEILLGIWLERPADPAANSLRWPSDTSATDASDILLRDGTADNNVRGLTV